MSDQMTANAIGLYLDAETANLRNMQRAEKIEEAARAMLAALEAALFDLSHTAKSLPQINAAIAQAESAGIVAED